MFEQEHVIEVRVEALTYAMWERARRKVEAERGSVISDAELIRIGSWLVLTTRPDGTIPGRTEVRQPVSDLPIGHDSPRPEPARCVRHTFPAAPASSGRPLLDALAKARQWLRRHGVRPGSGNEECD